MLFNTIIFLENENIPDFYIKVEAVISVPRLTEALESYDTSEQGLQELFKEPSFFEIFSEKFVVHILDHKEVATH